MTNDTISYSQSYLDAFEKVLSRIRFGDWKFRLDRAVHAHPFVPRLRIEVREPDNYTPGLQARPFVFLLLVPSYFINETMMAKWVLGCVEYISLHHAEEKFTYDGQRIFDPHENCKLLRANFVRLFQWWRGQLEWERKWLAQYQSRNAGAPARLKQIDDELWLGAHIATGGDDESVRAVRPHLVRSTLNRKVSEIERAERGERLM
jgi:hypothetical protein